MMHFKQIHSTKWQSSYGLRLFINYFVDNILVVSTILSVFFLSFFSFLKTPFQVIFAFPVSNCSLTLYMKGF